MDNTNTNTNNLYAVADTLAAALGFSLTYTVAVTLLKATRDADRFVAEHNGLAAFVFVSNLIVVSLRSVRTGTRSATRCLALIQSASRNKLGGEYLVSDAYIAACLSGVPASKIVAWTALAAYKELLSAARSECAA